MIISFLQQGETQKRFTNAKTQCGRPSRACDKTFYHPRTTMCIQILSEATAADTVWWTIWKVLGSLTTLQRVLQGFATKERLLATGSLPMNKPELHWKRTRPWSEPWQRLTSCPISRRRASKPYPFAICWLMQAERKKRKTVNLHLI